jgi:hypothetical protein
VVTGRSRVALYLARILAGLTIIGPLVAIGFGIVCVVCVYAAPTTLSLSGLTGPAGLSQTQLESWAADNAQKVICDLPSDNLTVNVDYGPVANGLGAVITKRPPANVPAPTPGELRAAAVQVADQNWASYQRQFLYPPTSLMIKTGAVARTRSRHRIPRRPRLRLAARTTDRCRRPHDRARDHLTPIVLRVRIPHLENLQRAVVGVATAHLEPGQLPPAFGGERPGLPTHRIDHHRRLRHPRGDHRMDRPRRLAHGDPRRLTTLTTVHLHTARRRCAMARRLTRGKE